ncbi:hypothetical protein [uncultured Mediterranean phage uvMED]|nr:hypothetical protein [uncultured Mediterranean phage uvMED]
MIVDTKHGQYECKDITRKQRRDLYKKVKQIYASEDMEKMHDLADEFAILAFGDEGKANEKLGKLTAIEEDEVLMTIINAYMGIETPLDIGG